MLAQDITALDAAMFGIEVTSMVMSPTGEARFYPSGNPLK